MLKKINEARRQAQKLAETRDMQNERYARMVEFRLKQQRDEEAQRQRNGQMKSNMGTKYQQMKADILAQNRSDYKRIRQQR